MGGINDYIHIGQKMKHIRKMSGISQKDMAIKLGIAQSSYSNYENENREPPFSLICLFCEKFGISVDSIINSEIQTLKNDVDEKETFPDRLKKFRIAKGLTQNQIADVLGVSQNAVYNWENGRREPSLGAIKQIAEILDTTMFDLIGEEYKNGDSLDEFERLKKENENLKRQNEKLLKEREEILKILGNI